MTETKGYRIRPEAAEDFDAIHELVREAFRTAPVADGDEQDFVRRLRAGPGYVPGLALVAEGTPPAEGLLGHIMLTVISFTAGQPAGSCASVQGAGPFSVLLLAPLCVRQEDRSRGIGGALVQSAFERARAMGFSAVFLVGDPGYYSRFGFRPAADFGIRNGTDAIPQQYVQACELHPGALAGKSGVVQLV